ncbi:uncharacterized protein [Gorilla gorilla gorilla]|uniref:uncharacterized protein n=1 Tax=Gorilla gorilla gorilla TaxID=9595 RepID=UPI00300A4466
MCLLAGPLGTRPLALRGLCSCCSLLSQRTTVSGAPRPSVRSDLAPSDRLLPVPGRRRCARAGLCQASRLNARLPPPPLHPLLPPPLAFNPTRHPHSAPQPGPERAPRVLARAEGSPGSKGRSPEGTPSLLCPGGQKRTAGRWDRPGPRYATAHTGLAGRGSLMTGTYMDARMPRSQRLVPWVAGSGWF